MGIAKIFIIHSEKDNEVLRKLISEYNDRVFGNTTLEMSFVDSSQATQLGRDFGVEIKTRIDESKCVLAVITPNSKKSVWTNQEIGYTIGKGKCILPIKKRSMASSGCGLIHSNIDSQLYSKGQRKFPKVDGFLETRFKKMAVKIVKSPIVTKSIGEGTRVRTRRVSLSDTE